MPSESFEQLAARLLAGTASQPIAALKPPSWWRPFGQGNLGLHLPDWMQEDEAPKLEDQLAEAAESEGLLPKVGRPALGALAAVGNFLDNITGAQAVRGLLAGEGTPGLADNFETFLRNLPGVGLSSVGRDVSFRQIRQEFGRVTGLDTTIDNEWGETIVDVVGSVLFDPGTYLSLGATVPTKAAAALASGRRIVGLGAGARAAARTVPKLASGAAVPLAESLETGLRAAVVMRVPWTDHGVAIVPRFTAFGRFLALDVKFANGLERLFGALSTTPIAGGLMRFFSNRITKVANRPGEEGARQGAVLRTFIGELPQRMEGWRSGFQATVDRQFNRIIYHNEDILRDPQKARAIRALTELGVESSDELASLPIAIRNRTYFWGQRRLSRALADEGLSDEYLAAIESGSRETVEAFIEKHPDLPIPPNVLRDLGIEARRGLDVYEPFRDFTPTAERIADVVTEAGVKPTRGMAGRSGIAAEIDSKTNEVLERNAKELEEFFAGFDRGELESAIEIANQGRALMQNLADGEIRAHILNRTIEGYFPRFKNPKLKASLDNLVDRRVTELGGEEAGEAWRRFTQGRKFTDLVAEQVEAVFRELGTKHTAFRPLVDDERIGLLDRLMGKLFDENTIQRLKGGDRAEREMAEFLSTNPALDWYRRGQSHVEALTHKELLDHVQSAHSPMVIHRTRLKDYKNTEHARDPSIVPMIRIESTKLRELPSGKPLAAAVTTERSAGVDVAREQVRSYFRSEIKSAKIPFRAKERNLRNALDLDDANPRRLQIGSGDHEAVIGLKNALTSRADLRVRIGKATGKRKARLEEEMVLLDKRIDEMREGIRAGIQETKDDLAETLGPLRARRDKALSDLTEIRKDTPEGATFADELYLSDVAKHQGYLALDELERTRPALYERLTGGESNPEVLWMDREGVDSVFGPQGMLARMRAPDPLGGSAAVALYDKASYVWKAFQVALPSVGVPLWPQTRLRDYISNIALLMQGGASPRGIFRAMRDAWRINKAYGKFWRSGGTEGADALANVVLRNGMTGDELVSKLQSTGLLNSSFARDVLVTSESQSIRALQPAYRKPFKEWIDPRPTKGASFQAAWQIAEFADNHSKLVGVIEALDRGMHIDDAIDWVRKWTYDPKGHHLLSNGERYLGRRVIPFYSWLRWVIGAETKALLTKPGTVNWLTHVKNETEANVSGLDREKTDDIAHDFLVSQLGIPIRREGANVDYFLLGSYLPQAELGDIASQFDKLADPKKRNGFFDYIGAQLNPVLRNLIEQGINRSFYTGRKIEELPGEATEFMGLEVSKRMASVIRSIRTLNEIDRLGVFFRRREQASVPEDPFLRIMGSGFGVLPRTSALDVDRETDYAMRGIGVELSRLKGKMNKLVRDPERPARATNLAQVLEEIGIEAARKARMKQLRKQAGLPEEPEKKGR